MPEIDALIAAINKKQKEEVLIRGSDLQHITFQRISTGSLAFDLALGGGWPLNCWNEVIGLESSGKTVLALKTIGCNQELNPQYHTLWVAAEDPPPQEWAEALGVDVGRITFVMTNVMENVYDAVLAVLDERAVDAVVIDSYPALVPSEEDDKNMMELTVGRGAYMTNKFMRKSLSAQRRSLTESDRPCLGIFINQWRDRIGGYGDPRTTPGGKGKNYSFLTRVEVSRDEWLTDEAKVKTGQAIKVRTIKNKTAAPQKTASVDFYFEESKGHPKGSYDLFKEMWNLGVVYDIVEQKGSWYHFGGRKWQGEKAALEELRDSPLLVRDIIDQVRFLLLNEPIPEYDSTPTPKRRRVARS